MIWYLVIFVAKVIEVSLMTLRTVLITKGEKVLGAFIGIFEVSIWIALTSFVLTGLKDDPFKMVVYALGFATGIFIGSTVEEKLAIGIITVQVIVSEDEGRILTENLREKGIGITVIDGQGLSEAKKVLILHIQRKKRKELINQIVDIVPGALISTNDLKTIYGGYGLIRK